MPQIIEPGPNLGQLLGTGISQGIKKFEALKGLASLGIPLEHAIGISSLPEKLQGLVIERFLSGQRNAEAQGETPSGAAPQDNFLKAISAGMSPEQQRDQAEIDRSTRKEMDDIFARAKLAESAKKGNQQLRKYISQGLPAPATASVTKLLKKLGLDVGAYTLGSSGQQFESERLRRLENVRHLLGGRPAAATIEKDLEQFASLLDSDEAKLAKIASDEARNDYDIALAKAYRQAIKENGNRRSYQTLERAREIAEAQVGNLEQKMKAYDELIPKLAEGKRLKHPPQNPKEGNKWFQNGVLHKFSGGKWDPPLPKKG